MKLLIDQNISFRIIKKIQPFFPNSKHISDLGLKDFSDTEIWNYAKTNRFAIVTFDADFVDIANIKGISPKIIWLRTGYLTTNSIVKLLKNHQLIINTFLKNSNYKEIACLEIK